MVSEDHMVKKNQSKKKKKKKKKEENEEVEFAFIEVRRRISVFA